jgi:hypothetical protein
MIIRTAKKVQHPYVSARVNIFSSNMKNTGSLKRQKACIMMISAICSGWGESSNDIQRKD